MDQDAVVGKLVREYLENERRAVSLSRELRELAAPLAEIGGLLAADPREVHTTGRGLENRLETRTPLPLDALERVRQLLDEYHAALESKTRMEQDLRKMGLEPFIQN